MQKNSIETRGELLHTSVCKPTFAGIDLESRTRESKGREPFGRFKGSGGKRNPPAAFLWDRKPVSFVRTKEMGLHWFALRYTVHQKNTSRCREVLRFIRLPDGADTVRIRSFSDPRRFPAADSGG